MGYVKFIGILALFITTAFANVDINLPLLSTKQSEKNIRYISNDGKITIYQKDSGSLYYSTNYQIKKILTGPRGTNYLVTLSQDKSAALIEQNLKFHSCNRILCHNKIFFWILGKDKPQSISEGVNAKLHLNKKWISYYNQFDKKIHFQSLDSDIIEFQISLTPKNHPYFIPEVLMINDSTVFYTDVNKDGYTAILKFDRGSNKVTTISRSDMPGLKIELCLTNQHLVFGQFPLYDTNAISSISVVPRSTYNFQEMITKYQSEKRDLGNLFCSQKKEEVTFIKTRSHFPNLPYGPTDAARLNLKNEKVEYLSKLGIVTQMTKLDDQFILPLHGKFYVLEGKNKFNDDAFKKLKGEKK